MLTLFRACPVSLGFRRTSHSPSTSFAGRTSEPEWVCPVSKSAAQSWRPCASPQPKTGVVNSGGGPPQPRSAALMPDFRTGVPVGPVVINLPNLCRSCPAALAQHPHHHRIVRGTAGFRKPVKGVRGCSWLRQWLRLSRTSGWWLADVRGIVRAVGGGFFEPARTPKDGRDASFFTANRTKLWTVLSAKVRWRGNSFGVRRVLRMVRPVVDNEPVFRVLVNPAARNAHR